MIDLQERFAQLDEIETEDLWWEIRTRAEQDVERVPPPFHAGRKKLVAAVAAAVVIVVLIGVALLVGFTQEEADPVITQPTPPTSLAPTPSTTVSTPPSTLSAPPSTVPPASLADILEWTLVTVPSAVDFECSRNAQQLDEFCLTPYGAALWDVMTLDGQLWAVGHDGSAGDWDAIIVTSNDGETWDRVPDPEGIFGGPGNQTIRALAAADGKLVAVGSTDCSAVGVDYPSDTSPPYSRDLWGRCPQVWISEDGIVWDSSPLSAFRTQDNVPLAEALAAGPLAPDLGFPARGYDMFDVAWTGSEFLAIGPAIWRSPDGYTWTIEAWPSENLRGECTPECHANDLLLTGEGMIAVGKDPTLQASPRGGKVSLWTSSDGVAWEQIRPDMPSWSELFSSIPTKDGYLIVGSGDGGQAVLTMNIDSDVSTTQSLELLPDPEGCCGTANDVVADGERLLAVGFQLNSRFLFEGGAARVWLSLDGGETWQMYPEDDYSILGTYHSTSHDAEMSAATVFEDRIIVVGWFNTDAAVWTGTWTDR